MHGQTRPYSVWKPASFSFGFQELPWQTKIEHLDTVLNKHTEELTRGEFLVVTPGQIRVAGHPRA